MKIGIFVPNWIGDAVMALPFLAKCREKHKQDTILTIGRKWVSPIFESSPLVDELVTIQTGEEIGFSGATKVGQRLRTLAFDKIYILPGSWRSAYIAWLSRAKERIGYSGQFRSFFLTDSRSLKSLKSHRSQRYLNLIDTELFNIDLGTIYITEDEIDKAKKRLELLGFESPMVIFPGSSAASRRPPKLLLSQILELALNSNTDIILMGGRKEIPLANELVKESKGVKSVCGETTLRESIAIIKICSGAIGADSGLGHIAANLGLPTISLFGAGDPEITGPIGNSTEIIFENVHCSPCKKNLCYNKNNPLFCFNSMTPETIWYKYCRLIKKVNT